MPGGQTGAHPAGGSGGSEGGSDHGEVPALTETVQEPAKVMRIGSMIKQLLEEVRQAPLDEDSRGRLREIYDTSIRELAGGLSPDLAAELDRLALPFEDGTPSESALRIAQAQLVGWLEGLFHGIQATLFAQQMAARSQLEEMRRRGLPPGIPGQAHPGPDEDDARSRPGTYL
ncbi:MAG: bacterial proteasome activator family protein [Acidimicrobiales bacterium]